MYDIIFAGGGLAAGLAAWRLHRQRPHLKLLIVEQNTTLGGNHTWSFFQSDLTESQFRWVQPLVEYSWPHYEVRFPDLQRTIDSTYCTLTSEGFHNNLTSLLPPESLMLNTPIDTVSGLDVVLKNGQRVSARCVIDCRGPGKSQHLAIGFQKFTGLRLSLAKPHQLDGPVIMDATIPQEQNYRFFYSLPLSPTEILIEDTRYSDQPDIDEAADRKTISKYAEMQGWEIQNHIKEERGVLPITLGGNIHALWKSAPRLPRLGLRGAMFHAVTGYSLPDAVRTADELAGCQGIISHGTAYNLLYKMAVRHWKSQAYLRLLNRMFFIAAQPDKRYRVLAHFYRLPQPVIERFYAGRLTVSDKLKILTGKPPVPVLSAIRCIPEYSVTIADKWHSNQESFSP